MAKYTELLSEYLTSGGQLPTAFDQIEGFTDLFIAEYIDREIGYETPTIFEIKLNQRANIVIPPYLARKEAIDAATALLLNPTKKHVRSGSTERSKQGEIVHADSVKEENTEFNKTGAILHETIPYTTTTTVTKMGEKSTATTGEDTTTPGATTNKTWDLPTASVLSGGSIGVDPSTVEQSTPGATTVKHGTTVTETFKDYQDITAVDVSQTQEMESYNRYSETHNTITKPTTNTESYNDYKDIEQYQNITDTETGLTSSEALAIKQEYETQVLNLMQMLLAEFDSCFMQVF